METTTTEPITVTVADEQSREVIVDTPTKKVPQKKRARGGKKKQPGDKKKKKQLSQRIGLSISFAHIQKIAKVYFNRHNGPHCLRDYRLHVAVDKKETAAPAAVGAGAAEPAPPKYKFSNIAVRDDFVISTVAFAQHVVRKLAEELFEFTRVQNHRRPSLEILKKFVTSFEPRDNTPLRSAIAAFFVKTWADQYDAESQHYRPMQIQNLPRHAPEFSLPEGTVTSASHRRTVPRAPGIAASAAPAPAATPVAASVDEKKPAGPPPTFEQQFATRTLNQMVAIRDIFQALRDENPQFATMTIAGAIPRFFSDLVNWLVAGLMKSVAGVLPVTGHKTLSSQILFATLRTLNGTYNDPLITGAIEFASTNLGSFETTSNAANVERAKKSLEKLLATVGGGDIDEERAKRLDEKIKRLRNIVEKAEKESAEKEKRKAPVASTPAKRTPSRAGAATAAPTPVQMTPVSVAAPAATRKFADKEDEEDEDVGDDVVD